MPSPDAERKVINRLWRAQGELGAVITAVESGADCRDADTQLAAASKALDRAGFTIVASTMRNCLADPDSEPISPGELEKLFLSLA